MKRAEQFLVFLPVHTIIFVLGLLFVSFDSFAQPQEGEAYATPECYPETYTFDKAIDFEAKAETGRALWFYINLFASEPDSAVLSVRRMAKTLNNTEAELRKSFAMYFNFDPDNLNSAYPGLDPKNPVMRKKTRYLDEIISCLDDQYWIPWRTKTLNLQGVDFYREENYEEAQACFDKAVAHHATGQVLFNRGYLYSKTGKYEEAIGDFTLSIEKNYRVAEAHYQRGFNMAKLDRKEEAIAEYSVAIEMDSSMVDAYLNRGFELYLSGQYTESLPDFDRVIALDPTNSEGWVSRGFAHHKLNNLTEACENWQKAYNLGLKRTSKIITKYCK